MLENGRPACTRRWNVSRATLAALTAAALVAPTGALAIASPAASVPATKSVQVDAAGTAVTLVTGDRVVVPAGAGPIVLGAARDRSGPAFSFAAPDGDRYVVPAIAAPYAGRQLAWSLFDVSALARNSVAAGTRTPVALSFAAGSVPKASPGVTLTSVSGSTAKGYARGVDFADALRERIGADVAAGKPAGSTPLPGGLTKMALAEPAPSALGPSATPAFVQHIVQLTATDLAGQPAGFSFVLLYNMDAISRVNGAVVPVTDGIGRVALPAGNYLAIAEFVDFDAQGAEGKASPIAARFVTSTFAVPDTSAVTPVALDERSATSRVSATTPRPATQDHIVVGFSPRDAAGQFGAGVDAVGFGPAGTPDGGDFYVSPTPAPTVGGLRYVVEWGGTSPDGASSPYRYDVAFGSDDVPAHETYRVRTGELAAVHERFYSDPAGSDQSFSTMPNDPVIGLLGIAVDGSVSGNVTEYAGTALGGKWIQLAFIGDVSYEADLHTFAAQDAYSIDWGRGPQAPGFGQHTGPILGPCRACSAGDTLALIFADEAGDSEPDHEGSVGAPTSFSLYRDGTALVVGDSAIGAVESGIPITPSTYRAVFDVDRSGQDSVTQSTRTHTDLTLRYDPDPGPGSRMPADVTCLDGFGSIPCCIDAPQSAPCNVLPVLSLGYHLAGDETNTSHAPVQVMGLDVGHLTYDGHGSHAAITSARVEVSFDGGTTWRRAVVTGHAGQYLATWPNPSSARGSSPALRVTATDAAGGSITQTIEHAYTIAQPETR
jgi:hypothetical protein